IATRMLDVDYGTITDYPGNYGQFIKAKALASTQLDAEAARIEKVIAEKKAFVERFKAKATKARQAQSRAKQLEKMEVPEAKVSSRRSPLFRFEQERPTGKDVVTVEELNKSYGTNRVLNQVDFRVQRGEKIGVIGENGIGKSTLLKIIAEQLAPDTGSLIWGHHVRLGYFAQDHHDLLTDPKLTPLDYVWGAVPAETTSVVRGILGRMLFSADEVNKKVAALSGGEAARLVFARLLAEKPNFLLLDEPTNHLDIEAIEGLAAALQAYEGTLIFVSHDRWFVSQVANRIIELKRTGMTDFSGNFQEYLAKDGADHLDTNVALKTEKDRKAERAQEDSAKAKSGASNQRGHDLKEGAATQSTEGQGGLSLSREERKKRANRLKSLPKKRDTLVAAIEKLEADKETIHARYAEPDFFVSAPADEQENLRTQEAQIETALEKALLDWEKVEAEIEELSQD
ncbi:MAG: ATP-binding cassette domain-containing protein, partial [Polyangiaceae bacterium]|nr:ATP-binding cassette domain-containing protein [Polyangiaceae bacterium]